MATKPKAKVPAKKKPAAPKKKANIYLTKAGLMNNHQGRQAGITEKRAYFLARCFGFGVCGSGGVASIARSKSSVRFSASLRGNNSIDLSSAACCAALGFVLFIVGV